MMSVEVRVLQYRETNSRPFVRLPQLLVRDDDSYICNGTCRKPENVLLVLACFCMFIFTFVLSTGILETHKQVDHIRY